MQEGAFAISYSYSSSYSYSNCIFSVHQCTRQHQPIYFSGQTPLDNLDPFWHTPRLTCSNSNGHEANGVPGGRSPHRLDQ
jgi:hypothetical protein